MVVTYKYPLQSTAFNMKQVAYLIFAVLVFFQLYTTIDAQKEPVQYPFDMGDD